MTKNNGIEVKFIFGAIAQICVFVKKTNRTNKFRLGQIEHINLKLNKEIISVDN